jgi:membrane protein insertase Oxa1/YidC/SpoIIIJ
MEVDYDEIQENKLIQNKSKGGWIGITDKYWLTALIPDQKSSIDTRFSDQLQKNIDNYQDWLEVQNSDLPGAWISIWGDRYLDEYKGNGILNLKFKFWTRLKMLFWLPQSRD